MKKNIILLSMLMLLSIAAYLVTSLATDSMDNYQSRFIDKRMINSAASEKLVDKVYFIIIDGLRYDQVESINMPFLNGLIKNKKAAFAAVKNNIPSYTRPVMAAHTTGASSEVSGITMNEQHRALEIPSIFGLARDQGKKTAASTQFWYAELINRQLPYNHPAEYWQEDKSLPIQKAFFYTDDDEKDSRVYDAAKKIVAQYKPDLMLIQTLAVDQAGHDYGAKSRQYHEAVKNVDRLLEQFYNSVPDKDSAVFFITSDHGHRDNGGHGGYEETVHKVPLLVTGKGVRPGKTETELHQTDLAPTISAIMGLPFTPYMQGRIIDDLFDFDNKQMTAKKSLLFEEKKIFVRNFAKVTGTTPILTNDNNDSNYAYLGTYMEDTKARTLKEGYLARTIIMHLVFFATLIGYFRFFRPGRGFIINYKLPALIYFFLFNILFYAQNYAYSYSGIPERSEFISHISATAVAAFLAAALAQKIIMRKGESTVREINPLIHLSFSVLLGLLWIVLYCYTQVGLKIDLFLPNLDLFVLLFVTTFQMMIVAGAGLVFGILDLAIGTWLSHRLKNKHSC